MDKTRVSEIASLALFGIGWALPEPFGPALKTAGLFALSGALTNHLAIYMLFHKVPLLKGSGVIEENFERFKEAIHDLVMEQFFSPGQIEKQLRVEEDRLDLGSLIETADFDPAFDALIQSVQESKLGQMLSLFGGAESLETLRGPFNRRLRAALAKIVRSEAFRRQLHAQIHERGLGEDLAQRIGAIVRRRLDAMTPRTVRELIERLIHEHLGWLVVWGAVLGGAMGVVSSFLL
ncbi:DUF445 family protein [Nitratifractor sp.]